MDVALPLPTADAVRARQRVLIVNDAVVVRRMFSRWIAAEPDLQVVGSLRSGTEALRELPRLDPDVAVLDVEMPDINGIAVLPRLLELRPPRPGERTRAVLSTPDPRLFPGVLLSAPACTSIHLANFCTGGFATRVARPQQRSQISFATLPPSQWHSIWGWWK